MLVLFIGINVMLKPDCGKRVEFYLNTVDVCAAVESAVALLVEGEVSQAVVHTAPEVQVQVEPDTIILHVHIVQLLQVVIMAAVLRLHLLNLNKRKKVVVNVRMILEQNCLVAYQLLAMLQV